MGKTQIRLKTRLRGAIRVAGVVGEARVIRSRRCQGVRKNVRVNGGKIEGILELMKVREKEY